MARPNSPSIAPWVALVAFAWHPLRGVLVLRLYMCTPMAIVDLSISIYRHRNHEYNPCETKAE